MDKLTMAHDWVMKHGDPENFKLSIADAWEYADAMQAEADKRKPMVQGGYPKPIGSSVVGVVSNEYWWTNRDEKGNCLHNKKSFGGISCLSCKQLLTPDFLREDKLENFRLDWGSAPDGFDWWAMDESGLAYWYKLDKAPFVIYGTAQWTFTESSGDNIGAPLFGYEGEWHYSLRNRPQEDKQSKPLDFQIDWSQAHEAANWWVVDTDGNASWFVSKPSSDAGYWDVNDNSSVYLAPSFGYTGAWQDSLRKRPQENNQ